MLAILPQIYAHFDVLSTGLNAVVYQNWQIWVMTNSAMLKMKSLHHHEGGSNRRMWSLWSAALTTMKYSFQDLSSMCWREISNIITLRNTPRIVCRVLRSNELPFQNFDQNSPFWPPFIVLTTFAILTDKTDMRDRTDKKAMFVLSLWHLFVKGSFCNLS